MKTTLLITAVFILIFLTSPASFFGVVAIPRAEAGGAKCPPVIEKKYGRIKVSPREIFRCLRVKKFHNFSTMKIKRGLYYLRARDAKGRRVSLVIDPYSGEIVRLRYR